MDKGEIYRSLNRTLLINWFNFSHACMDWGEINHLTGENRSGKTTIIDAIYMVMNADIKGRYFNAAAREATGRRQKRDLKGYMCKLINTDASGNKIYERDKENFNTYVALEWLDMKENKPFIMGFVGEYNARKGDIDHRWFLISGISIKGMDEFTDKDSRIPLTISALKAKFQTLNSYGNCSCDLFERMEDFLRARSARLGSPNTKYFELFSKAISFRDMNIQEFIRNYICDEEEDTLKVESLEGIIAEYDRLAALSRQYRMKNELLSAEKELNESYLEAHVRRCSLDYTRAKILLHKAESDQDERIASLESFREMSSNLQAEAEECENERVSLENEYEETLRDERDNSKAERIEALQQKRAEYSSERDKFRSQASRDINEAHSFGNAWLSSVRKLVENNITDFSGEDGQTAMALASLEESAINDFAFKTAGEAYSRYCDDVNEKLYSITSALSEAQNEFNEVSSLLDRLRDGILPYPEYIESVRQLLAEKLDCEVKLLAECVEEVDSRLAQRIEAYLGEKRFAFIVPKNMEDYAEMLLMQVKGSENLYLLRAGQSCREYKFDVASVMKVSDPLVSEYLSNVLPFYISSFDHFCENGATIRLAENGDRFLGREALEEQKKEAEEKRSSLGYKLKDLTLRRDALVNAKRNFRDRGLLAVIVERLPETASRIQSFSDGISEVTEELDDLFSDPELMDIANRKSDIRARQEENRNNAGRIQREIGRTEDRITVLEKQIPENEKRISELAASADTLSSSFTADEKTSAEDTFRKWRSRGLDGLGELEKLAKLAQDDENRAERARRSKRFEFIETCNANDMRSHVDDDEPFITFCMQDGVDFAAAEEKFREDEEKARHNFQSEVLAQMSATFERMAERIANINKAIPKQYHYRFVMRQKKDFASVFEMIKDSEIKMVSPEANLFNDVIFQRYESTIKQLIALLRNSLGEGVKSGLNYRDCRNYYDFDLMFTDEMGNEQSLTNLIGIKSGGETQEPLYIALFASIAQACHVNLPSANDTVRLVVFDEAFSKMDRTRIHRCLQLISQFHLQAIFLTPPEKIREVNSAGLDITTNIVINPSRKKEGSSSIVMRADTSVAFNQMKVGDI